MRQADLTRIMSCMRRAERGEELTIGFLGGSITQGSLASAHENSYAYRVFTWWRKTFPQAELHYVNAGIGGTTSHYGVARVVEELLMYQPDFVVLDFSVNDEANSFFQETYEGLVRRLLSWASKPALLLLQHVFYDTGNNAQEFHNAVGDWYQVPYVSMRDTLYRRMKAGEFTREELTPDGLHPNDKGHALAAGEVIAFLEAVRAKQERQDREDTGELPRPMTANAYENAKRLTIRELSPILDGFHADTREKIGHLDHFKNGWIGKKPGARIVFEIEASCIAVQYRRTVKRPALSAHLTLDGDTQNPILLEGNFEEDWGDFLCLVPILRQAEQNKHVIEIKIPEHEPENATPFYLMALIIA